jgi:hypothetical protein
MHLAVIHCSVLVAPKLLPSAIGSHAYPCTLAVKLPRHPHPGRRERSGRVGQTRSPKVRMKAKKAASPTDAESGVPDGCGVASSQRANVN